MHTFLRNGELAGGSAWQLRGRDLGLGQHHAIGSLHGADVVLVGCSTDQADLVVAAVRARVGPGEPMGTKFGKQAR